MYTQLIYNRPSRILSTSPAFFLLSSSVSFFWRALIFKISAAPIPEAYPPKWAQWSTVTIFVGLFIETISKPIKIARNPIEVSDGQFSGGKPKKVTLSEPLSSMYVDTMPQRAPEAPSEDEAKLLLSTQEVRDA